MIRKTKGSQKKKGNWDSIIGVGRGGEYDKRKQTTIRKKNVAIKRQRTGLPLNITPATS